MCLGQTVTANMFTIYETLLGLKFEEVPVPEQLHWHPEASFLCTNQRFRNDDVLGGLAPRMLMFRGVAGWLGGGPYTS